MGVNEQLVIMIGLDVGQDAYDDMRNSEEEMDEVLEAESIDEKKDGECVIVYDGMSGKYCMVGIKLFATDRYGPIEGLGTFKLGNPTAEAITKIQNMLMKN